MSCYIITYDLVTSSGRNRSSDYAALLEQVKSYKTWAKITESCFAVVSNKSSKEIRDHFKSNLRNGDRLFVVKSSGIGAWSNPICRNEWLKEHL